MDLFVGNAKKKKKHTHKQTHKIRTFIVRFGLEILSESMIQWNKGQHDFLETINKPKKWNAKWIEYNDNLITFERGDSVKWIWIGENRNERK